MFGVVAVLCARSLLQDEWENAGVARVKDTKDATSLEGTGNNLPLGDGVV